MPALPGFDGNGGSPDPSANAAEANDRSNSAIAKILFMVVLLDGGSSPETVYSRGRVAQALCA
jgi:hypothetical protein